MGSSPVYSDSNPRMSLTYTLDTKRPSELKSSQKPSPALSHIVSVEAQATGRQQAHMGTLGGRRFYEDKPLAGPPPFANTDLPVFSPPHPPNYAPCRPHSHSALHKRAQYSVEVKSLSLESNRSRFYFWLQILTKVRNIFVASVKLLGDSYACTCVCMCLYLN